MVIFALSKSVCQDNKPFSSHQAGIHGGLTTGVGFSYRYWPNRLGLQLTLLPIKVDEEWKDILGVQEFARSFSPIGDTEKFISIGVSGLYTLKKLQSYRLISYFGNHVLINRNSETYNLGGGVGISFYKKVSFSLMLGYGAFDVLGQFNLYPTAELGLYLCFEKQK